MNIKEIYEKQTFSRIYFSSNSQFFSFQLEPHKNYEGTCNNKTLNNQLWEILYGIQILAGQNLKPNIDVCDRCVNSDSEFWTFDYILTMT